MSSPPSVLYDNKTEARYASIRTRRCARVGASVTVLVAGVILYWFLLGTLATTTRDAMQLALWLTASALPGMLLVFGLILELQKPLDIRVQSDAIWTSGRRRLPITMLVGSGVEETSASIRLRRPGAQSKRFWFTITKTDLSNPERFKAALEAVFTEDGDNKWEASPPTDLPPPLLGS